MDRFFFSMWLHSFSSGVNASYLQYIKDELLFSIEPLKRNMPDFQCIFVETEGLFKVRHTEHQRAVESYFRVMEHLLAWVQTTHFLMSYERGELKRIVKW